RQRLRRRTRGSARSRSRAARFCRSRSKASRRRQESEPGRQEFGSSAAESAVMSGEPAATPRSRPLLDLMRAGILCAVYFGTAGFGLLLDPVGGFATAVWPPTGIALVALTLYGYGLWPGIALGAFLINASRGAPVPAALGLAAGNTLEA